MPFKHFSRIKVHGIEIEKHINLLFVAVDKDDRYHFHKCDHNEANGTSKAVEHFQPVFSCTGTEDEADEETNDTYYA